MQRKVVKSFTILGCILLLALFIGILNNYLKVRAFKTSYGYQLAVFDSEGFKPKPGWGVIKQEKDFDLKFHSNYFVPMISDSLTFLASSYNSFIDFYGSIYHTDRRTVAQKILIAYIALNRTKKKFSIKNIFYDLSGLYLHERKNSIDEFFTDYIWRKKQNL